MKRAWGILGLGMALSISCAHAAASDSLPDYRVCRSFGHVRDCIQLNEKCAGGVVRKTGSEARSCDPMSAQACKALEELMKKTALDLQKLPGSERTFDDAARPCDGFTLIVPDHLAQTCNATQPRGADALFKLFKGISGLCEEHR